jgi:transposase InsO family protein
MPKTPNTEDEEHQLAEAGEGGNVDGLMNCTWAQVMSEINSDYVKVNNMRAPRKGWEGEKDRDTPLSVARTPDEHALEAMLAEAIELTAEKSIVEAELSGAGAAPKRQRAAEVASEPAEVANGQHARAAQWSEADHRDARLLAKCKFPNKRMIGLAHDETHPSFATTWARVQRAHGFPPGDNGAKLKAEVKAYCESCLVCAKLKPAREKLEARAGSIRQRPFTQYAFDLIVLSEPDSRGFKYIFAVIDTFSGAVELFPLRKASVIDVAECLHDVLQRWTRPRSVRCDNAKSFAAAAVKEMLKMARIQQHFVAPYSHVSNGQIENANRRIEYLLRAMILDQRLGPNSKLNWSLLVPAVRGVINARAVGKHGCTPNDLLYGATAQRDVSIFEDEPWMVGYAECADAGDASCADAQLSVQEWRRQHQCLIDKCEVKQDELLQQLADLNDGSDDVGHLEPGDTVLLCVKGRRHHKLSAPWAGPYLALDRPEQDEGTNVVLVQHLATKVVSRVHVRDLKRCSLDLYDRVDDALPIAALDNFEYCVERILQHRPAGKRKAGKARARAKKDYEFEVLWADLPLEDGVNPSWEPWDNSSLRSCEAYRTYCLLPEVVDELGADFYAGEAEPALEESLKAKRRR